MGEATAAVVAPADPVRRHAFSRSDYHRMGETGILPPDARVELIEGEVVDMAPIGSRHAAVVRRLGKAFERLIGNRVLVSVQNPIAAGAWSEPQPDIALLSRREDFYRSAHPRPEDVLLIVEVADTTLRYDLDRKAPLYAAAGVVEVWIVDVEAERLHVLSDPAHGAYQRVRRVEPPATLAPLALPDAEIDVGALFGA